jgi:hypothetical protein
VDNLPTFSMLHLLPSLVDDWERLANALSPSHPFPEYRPRLALASCFLPIAIVAFLATPYMCMKAAGFIIGLVLFGMPVLSQFCGLTDVDYPPWRQLPSLKNTVLRGVPTNAQLTITLLRMGEYNKTPLGPPPGKDEPAGQQQVVEPRDLEYLGEANIPRQSYFKAK